MFYDWVLRIKSGHTLKSSGPHVLVTPVPGFENRGSLGSRS